MAATLFCFSFVSHSLKGSTDLELPYKLVYDIIHSRPAARAPNLALIFHGCLVDGHNDNFSAPTTRIDHSVSMHNKITLVVYRVCHKFYRKE